MNAKSYVHDMEKYPLLISYPRSGSTWINATLELYFNRPRLRAGPSTFLPDRDKRRDYMWFHDHDIYSDLKVKHDKIAYLYRNPTDVIFSLMKAEGPTFSQFISDNKKYNDAWNMYAHERDKFVNEQIKLLRKHYFKYLCNKKARVAVIYENFKGSGYYDEFEKLVRFLKPGAKLDENKLNKALEITTKQAIINKEIDKKYFNNNLLGQKYEKDRLDFYDRYGFLICQKLDIGAVLFSSKIKIF